MNNDMNWIFQALRTQVMHLPVLLISLAAIVIAIVRWRQAPQACLFCLLGFGLVFCLSTVMPFLQYFLIMGPGRQAADVRNAMMSVFSVTWSLLVAVAYVLLAVAIFAGRSKPAGDRN
jgi:hypothetical protein